MSEKVTAIFFSCRRLGLLKRVVESFLKYNTYPIEETIIVNDSANPNIHRILKEMYPDCTLVLNEKNMGLFGSIDLGYAHIKTDYFFHCEDDWMVLSGGFISKSLTIMQERKDIEEVWLLNMNSHGIEPEILETRGVKYQLAVENRFKDEQGFIYGWHGFATACSLKRKSDYLRVAPYTDLIKGWEGKTIWHREHAVGEAYHRLGYRTAVLTDERAVNIGIGQSEYKTGFER